MRAFLSAGHGPRPRGAGPDDPGNRTAGLEEADLTPVFARVVALKMRTAEPVLVPATTLPGRIQWVNRWARPGDVAVEIHLNAGPPAAYGAEVFYASGSARGKHLASVLHAALVRAGRSPRGERADTQSARGRLGWCRLTRPWAALVEVAFMTNDAERAWLVTPEATEAVAREIARALDTWP